MFLLCKNALKRPCSPKGQGSNATPDTQLRKGFPMARPPKNDHERRTAQLPPVRVTVAEQLHVHEQAEAAGLTPTDYLRTLALTEKVTPKPSRVDAALLSELNRIGVNINQIAHAYNVGRSEPAQLEYALGELVALMRKVDAVL